MTFEKILEKIKTYDKIIIHRHMKPDPDAIGSQVGLKTILKDNFPSKTILVTGFNEPSLLWMAEMDELSDNDFEGALVIVTDTANTDRIDDKRCFYGDYLIKIDHHPNDDAYGDIVCVDTTASSCSEMIADFAEVSGLSLSVDSARLLYTGIVGDTGRFLYPSTTSKTLQIASDLLSYGFDFSAISRQMETFSLKVAKLQSYVYEHIEIDKNGAARILIPYDVLEQYDVSDAETAAIVGAPGRIEGVEAWGIFVQQKDGHYRVRLRSKSKIINTIAKKHDGGGHPLASGANSYSLEENDVIYQEIKDLF